jgi:DNA-binding GntR family transcriptional regulator
LARITVLRAPEAAAQAIRDAIITGRLKPGQRLIEKRLAADMGIGQPTLREAFKELEFQGFVRKNPQRGTYVNQLGKDDYRMILEVRIALEVVAVERATRNMTAEAESELAAYVEGMKRAIEGDFDIAAFHENDVAFHRKLWALAGNEYLRKSLEGVAFRLFVFSVLDRNPGARHECQAAVEQHLGILAGIGSHEPAEARRAFVAHTLKFWNEIYEVGLEEDSISMTPIRERSLSRSDSAT